MLQSEVMKLSYRQGSGNCCYSKLGSSWLILLQAVMFGEEFHVASLLVG